MNKWLFKFARFKRKFPNSRKTARREVATNASAAQNVGSSQVNRFETINYAQLDQVDPELGYAPEEENSSEEDQILKVTTRKKMTKKGVYSTRNNRFDSDEEVSDFFKFKYYFKLILIY